MNEKKKSRKNKKKITKKENEIMMQPKITQIMITILC